MDTQRKNLQPKIFISYAREDAERARELYHRLEKEGFEPWMDTEKLLPGEMWENRIKKEIKDSNSFIACLSVNSTQKRGIIQKEIKAAFEIWQEKLEGDIYLIPVRLDDCEVPEKLQQFYWIDLYQDIEKNWQRLINAIKAGWKRQGFELEKEDEEIEGISNLVLIENNFLHLEFELDRDDPNFLRIVKEGHSALYRSMIEALRGTANLTIAGRSKDPERTVKFKQGDNPLMVIKKQKVTGCKWGWRYTEPIKCEEPELNIIRSSRTEHDDYLINFFDALAMIQSDAFMGRYVFSKSVKVSDDEMKTLEALNYYRNKCEHFVPTHFYAHRSDISIFLKPCLRIIKELLFRSGNIMPVYLPQNLENLISYISNKVEW